MREIKLVLKSIRASEDLKKSKVIATLEEDAGDVKVKLTITASTLADLEQYLETLSKGAIFEMSLKPIKEFNAGLGRFFEVLSEV